MSLNPYEPPRMGPEGYAPFHSLSPEEALARVRLPAVFLIVMAALTIVGRVAGLCFQLIALGQADAANGTAAAAGGIAGNGLALAFNLVTVVGAYKMMNLQSYSFARRAAIISVIPICSPCVLLGIPFGIWALVVLGNPQVKAAFRQI
jgi:hypothetical protein